jgi:hypothetical protein
VRGTSIPAQRLIAIVNWRPTNGVTAMIKKTVKVTQYVEVEVDEAKLNDEFMKEFSSYMFEADIDEHFRHLAAQEAQGFIPTKDYFLEGYGPLNEMGISMKVTDLECEIEAS